MHRDSTGLGHVLAWAAFPRALVTPLSTRHREELVKGFLALLTFLPAEGAKTGLSQVEPHFPHPTWPHLSVKMSLECVMLGGWGGGAQALLAKSATYGQIQAGDVPLRICWQMKFLVS